MTESRFAIIPADAIDDLRLTATDLRVLGVIAYHAGRDRSAWPKQKTIADRIQITREAVNRSISRLKNWGYIDVTSQTRRDGGQRENVYYVPLDPKLERLAVGANTGDETQPAPPPCDPTITPPVIAAITPNRGTDHKNIPPKPPKGGRRAASLENLDPLTVSAFDVVWKGWPEKGLERSAGRAVCLAAFAKATAKASPEALKLAALAYANKTKPAYAVGLQRWLNSGQFENFLPSPKAVQRQERRKLMHVAGKAGECLAAIQARYGEAAALSWLADVRWLETLVVAPSPFHAQQIHTRFGPVLDLHGFSVTHEQAA